MTGIRNSTLWLAGVALGGSLLWLTLGAIDARRVLAIALQADRFDALGIVVCAAVFVGLKAVRWGCLIRHLRPLRFERLLPSVLAGVAVNYAIPHGGELVRAWMLGRREGLPKMALLASIAAERLLDFCSILLLGIVALLTGHAVFQSLGPALVLLLAVSVVILAAALPFAFWPHRALGAWRTVLSPLPTRVHEEFMRLLAQGATGLASLRRASTVARVFGLSMVQWLLMTGCAWLSLRAVNVDPSPIQAVATMLILVVGTTLPTAPAHVGTTQVAFLLVAKPFGIDPEQAIAASFVYNVFVPLPLIVAGVGALLGSRGAAGLATRSPPD